MIFSLPGGVSCFWTDSAKETMFNPSETPTAMAVKTEFICALPTVPIMLIGIEFAP